MTKHFALADGFTDPDFSAWQSLAEKALKGASLDRLTATTYDGIAVKPLYTPNDVSQDLTGLPASSRDTFLPWDIRQTVLDSDPIKANLTALEDLERGVSSIEFCIDPKGFCGVAAQTASDYAALTAGIVSNIATIGLFAPDDPLHAANMLCAAIAPNLRQDAKIAFNLDPMAQAMTKGASLTLAQSAVFAKEVAATFPAASALRADARPIHEGGGSEAQELAVLIASGIAHLRAGEAIGQSPAHVDQTLLFTLSVGPDVVIEIAKL